MSLFYVSTSASLRPRVPRRCLPISSGGRGLCSVPVVHIVVMGCGRVGVALTHHLERLDHSVAVIDQEPAAFRRLGENFRGRQVLGVGFDRETLIEAGIEQAGAFAAVSSGDNSNIISARVARETFNVPSVVARIYDPKRAEVYERLGIPTVATVPWTASRLLKRVLGEATAEVWRDPSGAVAMVHVSPDEGWVGHKVSEFESVTATRVALVTRFGTGELPVPSTVIQDGDSLHVLVTDDRAKALTQAAAHSPDGRSG
jgi:trk system potassium uptake protein